MRRRKKNNLVKSLCKSLKEVKDAQNGECKLLNWDEFEKELKKDD